jgi:hypothetical protein
MKPLTNIHIRIGLSLLSAIALLAIAASIYQPAIFAQAAGGDPKATIKSYNFSWKDHEHFYFRVQFQRLADLTKYTNKPWYFAVPYKDDASTKKSVVWKDSFVTYRDEKKFWATIRVTAIEPKYDVKPSAQTPGGPIRGTGKATVVITNDDGKHIAYDVPDPLNDLEEDQNP